MLAEHLHAHGVAAHIFTATPYGADLLRKLSMMTVHSERLDAEGMLQFMRTEGIATVVDATHPYAREVTRNIVLAAQQAGVEYIRVRRDDTLACCDENIITAVADTAEAVRWLTTTSGPVLLTTGSKELEAYCAIPEYEERLYTRVLAMPEVIEHCYALGFKGEHIIAMQGPFSYELNVALLKHCKARYLVTKNTGQAGGIDEKIAAAQVVGAHVVLIDRPDDEAGLSLEQVLLRLGVASTSGEL